MHKTFHILKVHSYYFIELEGTSLAHEKAEGRRSQVLLLIHVGSWTENLVIPNSLSTESCHWGHLHRYSG